MSKSAEETQKRLKLDQERQKLRNILEQPDRTGKRADGYLLSKIRKLDEELAK